MKLKQLQNIIDQRKQVEKVFKDAGEVGIIDINGPFFDAIWKAIESITSVLDPEGWIDWYIYENDYGKGGMKAYISGRESIIESTKDLYELMKDMEGTMKEDYTPGEGCMCLAHSESECGCYADWTPREVYELREQRDKMQYEREFFQSAFNEQGDVLSKVIEQRDRLVGALELLVTTDHESKDDFITRVKQALAAVEGGSDE
jgi:hypothetical protein